MAYLFMLFVGCSLFKISQTTNRQPIHYFQQLWQARIHRRFRVANARGSTTSLFFLRASLNFLPLSGSNYVARGRRPPPRPSTLMTKNQRFLKATKNPIPILMTSQHQRLVVEDLNKGLDWNAVITASPGFSPRRRLFNVELIFNAC
jgi:hypothetical protein